MYIESTSTVLKTKLNKANITQIDLNKLAVYRNEIKQTRQQRDNEMMLKKNLTEKILVTWKELKDIRIKQKFRNTDLKLIIKRKEVKRQKEEKQFDTDLKEELEEIMNEKQDEYNLELSVYEQKIKAYKLQKLRKNLGITANSPGLHMSYVVYTVYGIGRVAQARTGQYVRWFR